MSDINLTEVLEVDHYIDGFTYFKPIIKEPTLNKYVGLSLQEIEEQYGVKERDWVYFMCTQGIDLTKMEAVPLSESQKLVLKIEYEKVGVDHIVDLVSTSGEKKNLFRCTIDDSQLLPQDVEHILTRELHYYLRQLGTMCIKIPKEIA